MTVTRNQTQGPRLRAASTLTTQLELLRNHSFSVCRWYILNMKYMLYVHAGKLLYSGKLLREKMFEVSESFFPQKFLGMSSTGFT